METSLSTEALGQSKKEKNQNYKEKKIALCCPQSPGKVIIDKQTDFWNISRPAVSFYRLII